MKHTHISITENSLQTFFVEKLWLSRNLSVDRGVNLRFWPPLQGELNTLPSKMAFLAGSHIIAEFSLSMLLKVIDNYPRKKIETNIFLTHSKVCGKRTIVRS